MRFDECVELLEHLAEMRRQASALLVWEITEKRWALLGVWVVREAAREAMRNPHRKFEALADMATRMRTPAREWRPHSELARGGGADDAGEVCLNRPLLLVVLL